MNLIPLQNSRNSEEGKGKLIHDERDWYTPNLRDWTEYPIPGDPSSFPRDPLTQLS